MVLAPQGVFRICLTFCLAGFLALPCASLASWCESYREGPLTPVKVVVDGDTLVTKDGTRVRLVGVNAPEVAHGGEEGEAFSNQARQLLGKLVAESGGQVRLRAAEAPRDHYGRLLAYVYASNGASLAEALVTAGLGVLLVVPPNEALGNCLGPAELTARREGRGVWRRWPVKAKGLGREIAGFQVIRGRVQRVGRGRYSHWLELDGNLTVRIDHDDLASFSEPEILDLNGAEVEVRGWLTQGKDGPRVRVRHPTSLRRVGWQ